jgi:hypothetical protein
MKTSKLIMTGAATMLLVAATSAQVFTASTGAGNFWVPTTVPDGTGIPIASTINVSGMPTLTGSLIYDVDVWMKLTKPTAGGMVNGDFYATLINGSKSVVLLNRVGRTGSNAGYGDPGLNVWFSDGSANGNIHTYQDVVGFQPTGLTSASRTDSWTPDGRNTNPGQGNTSDSVNQSLSSLYSQNVNGEWILTVQDMSVGQSGVLTDWSVGFTAVPEPHQYAMVAGLALIAFATVRRLRNKNA